LYGDSRIAHLRDAPALRAEIDYWFELEPRINLGVFACHEARLVIVDADHPSLLSVDFETPTVASGRAGGGRHFYFASESRVTMTMCSWGHVNPPYVVFPGSVHPNGTVYEWLPNRAPEEIGFMPFEKAAPALGLASGV